MNAQVVVDRSQEASEPEKNVFHLECEICFKYLSATIKSRQPFVGSCGHSFCKRCAEKVYGNCGLCRAPFIPVKNYSLIKLLEKMDGIKSKLLEKKEKLKDIGIPVEDAIEDLAEEEEEEEKENPDDELQMNEELTLSLQRMRLFTPQLRPTEFLLMRPEIRQSLETLLDRLFKPFELGRFAQLPAEFTNPLVRQAYEAHLHLQHLYPEVVRAPEELEDNSENNIDIPDEEDGGDDERQPEIFLAGRPERLVFYQRFPDYVNSLIEQYRRRMNNEPPVQQDAVPVHRHVQQEVEHQERHQLVHQAEPRRSQRIARHNLNRVNIVPQYQNPPSQRRFNNCHQPRGNRR